MLNAVIVDVKLYKTMEEIKIGIFDFLKDSNEVTEESKEVDISKEIEHYIQFHVKGNFLIVSRDYYSNEEYGSEELTIYQQKGWDLISFTFNYEKGEYIYIFKKRMEE